MSQQPLNYLPPEPAPRQTIVSFPILWQCLRAGAFITVICAVVLPKVQSIYTQQGFKLPASTEFLINVRGMTWSGLWGCGWILIWLILIAIPFAWPRFMPAPVNTEGKKKRRSLGWFLFSLALLLLAAAIAVVSVMPLFMMVDAYQSANPQ